MDSYGRVLDDVRCAKRTVTVNEADKLKGAQRRLRNEIVHDLMVFACEVFLEEIPLSWRILEFAAMEAQYLIPMAVVKMTSDMILFCETELTNVALVCWRKNMHGTSGDPSRGDEGLHRIPQRPTHCYGLLYVNTTQGWEHSCVPLVGRAESGQYVCCKFAIYPKDFTSAELE